MDKDGVGATEIARTLRCSRSAVYKVPNAAALEHASMDYPGFGDSVRIKDTALTREKQVAGLHGVIYGFTTPSVSQVPVIGELSGDRAFNVFFDERSEGLWFVPELIELVSRSAQLEITIGGVAVEMVRRADGGWDEYITSPEKKRPWWKLWRR